MHSELTHHNPSISKNFKFCITFNARVGNNEINLLRTVKQKQSTDFKQYNTPPTIPTIPSLTQHQSLATQQQTKTEFNSTNSTA